MPRSLSNRATTETAVAAIEAGEPVVLPTDTVYGLCASADDRDAAERVYRLKRRNDDKPTSVIFSDVDTLFERIPELAGEQARLARSLFPGELTLVVPNPARRYAWLTGSRPDTLGVRVPVLPGPAGAVLGRVGAVLATSANVQGAPEAARLEDVADEILAGCGAVVDGGELPGVSSTVVDATGPEPVVLREGAVRAADVLARVAATA